MQHTDRKVAIVTDSAGSISREALTEYGIHEVPLRITFGDRVYRDRVDLQPDSFYQRLKESAELPKTAAPSPEDFLEAYRKAQGEAADILCITMSAKLSATFNAAKLGADMCRAPAGDRKVEVLDSRLAAAAEGWVVLAAARAAAAGQELAEVRSQAAEVAGRAHLVAMLATLKYLEMGGRVPKVIASLGALLDIKPLVSFKDGEIHALSRARTYQAATRQVLEESRKRMVDGRPLHMAVMHAAEPEKAARFKEEVARSFDCREIIVAELSPVIGSHTGPGVIGLAFYNEA